MCCGYACRCGSANTFLGPEAKPPRPEVKILKKLVGRRWKWQSRCLLILSLHDSLGALNPQNEDSEKRIQEPLEMIQVSADAANHIHRSWDQPPRFRFATSAERSTFFIFLNHHHPMTLKIHYSSPALRAPPRIWFASSAENADFLRLIIEHWDV